MSVIQYSLIPTPCIEKELRKKFPWIGHRPIMIPNGWLGLVHNTCQEIEAVLAPDKPKDVVEYFFATVRESRLRIFLQLTADIDGEARADAIKSLLSEAQAICNHVCYICGNKAIELSQYGNRRSVLPTCGDHDGEDADDDSNANSNGDEVTADRTEVAKEAATKTEVVTTDINHDAGNPNADLLETALKQNETKGEVPIEAQSAAIKLYDVTALRKLLSEASTRYRDRDDVTKIKAILNKLIKAGGERSLKPLPDKGVEFLDQLQADFPNFREVIDMLRGFNALSNAGEVPRIPVMLLLGPPGVGKTMFAEALAIGMHVPFKVVRMENQQAGAGLVGSADFWSNSKSGIVFDVLTNGECGNPVIVVDEIDKAASDNRYNPINGLYSLLESGSASAFHDESLPDICLNASRITWVLTANYVQSIPEPILSRARVFEIPRPDLDQSVQVAHRIYKMLLDESTSLKARFIGELSDDVTHLLASLSPRKMRLAIEIAMGRAALAGRDKLLVGDVDLVAKVAERKIGFI
jgi:ATP-dependent Lon protease